MCRSLNRYGELGTVRRTGVPGLTRQRCLVARWLTNGRGTRGREVDAQVCQDGVLSSPRASASKNAAIAQPANAARDRGEDFTGQEGLLKSTSATLLEAALDEEITGRLGHAKHRAPEGGSVNIRNGTQPKTVLTDAAREVTIKVLSRPGGKVRAGHRQEGGSPG